MIQTNELVGVLLSALLLLIGPTRPVATAPEDNHPMDPVEQEFGKPNPNAPAALSRFAFLSAELIVMGTNLRTDDDTKQIWNIKWAKRVGWNVGGPRAGGAWWSHVRGPIHHPRFHRACVRPRLYARHLHEHFRKTLHVAR